MSAQSVGKLNQHIVPDDIHMQHNLACGWNQQFARNPTYDVYIVAAGLQDFQDFAQVFVFFSAYPHPDELVMEVFAFFQSDFSVQSGVQKLSGKGSGLLARGNPVQPDQSCATSGWPQKGNSVPATPGKQRSTGVKSAQNFTEEVNAQATVNSMSAENASHNYGVNGRKVVRFLRGSLCWRQEWWLLDFESGL